MAGAEPNITKGKWVPDRKSDIRPQQSRKASGNRVVSPRPTRVAVARHSEWIFDGSVVRPAAVPTNIPALLLRAH